MMKIILQEDVPNLGVVGDLVTVKDGYARNYLIPQGKAVFASVRSMGELGHQQRLAAHRRTQKTAEAEINKDRIEGLSVCMSAKVAPPQLGEDGLPIKEKLQKLFGSITTRDIAKVLSGSSIEIDHRRITLSDRISTVGKFDAAVRLDGGVIATLPFWVIPTGAGDIEAEKKRVEAAQEALRKEKKEAAEREAAAKVKVEAPPPAEESEKEAEGEEEKPEEEKSE